MDLEINSNSELKLFMKNVLKELPKLPLDASYSFLLTHEKDIQELHEEKKGSFCPNCSCPWSVGCKRMRLWPPPRKISAIKSMKRREEIKRISRKEKTLLSLAENKQNALVIKCRVCDHEMINKFDLPKKVLAQKLKEENKNEVIIKPKKKKKKKQKEKNAGLYIPDAHINKSKSEETNVRNKKKKKANAGLSIPNEPSMKLKSENIDKSNISNKSDRLEHKTGTANNFSASKPQTSSKQHKSKVKNLKLNNCVMFKPVKVKKKKPTIASMKKAMKVQNMSFMTEINNKKSTLSLESFLGSLI